MERADATTLIAENHGSGASALRRRDALRHPFAEPLDHAMLDAARGETNGVRDRERRARAVSDDDQAAQPEKVGTAVRLRIEPVAKTLCRRGQFFLLVAAEMESPRAIIGV